MLSACCSSEVRLIDGVTINEETRRHTQRVRRDDTGVPASNEIVTECNEHLNATGLSALKAVPALVRTLDPTSIAREILFRPLQASLPGVHHLVSMDLTDSESPSDFIHEDLHDSRTLAAPTDQTLPFRAHLSYISCSIRDCSSRLR